MTTSFGHDAAMSSAVAAAGVAVAVLGQSGEIEAVNSAWERFRHNDAGEPISAGIGTNYFDICEQAGDQPGAGLVATTLRRALAGELDATEATGIPSQPISGQGWFDVSVSARLSDDGDAIGATITLAPVATPQRPDAADVAMPEPLSDVPDADGAIAWAMVEASPDALVMTDEFGVIELVNSQSEKLFGYDRVEMLGRPVEMLLPESLAQTHTAHRTRFRVSPEVRAMGSGLDLRARRSDGSEVPVEVSLSPLRVQGDLHVIAAIRDVSERVEAEAKAQLIQRTIDAAHDGVFMFPASGDMLFAYANQGAIDQVGYRRDELLEMTPLHIKPEFTRTRFLDVIEPLVRGEIPRLVIQTVHRRKDGRDVPVEIILEYPESVDSVGPRLMVALVRDITDNLEAAALLQRSEERFRSAFIDGPIAMVLTEVSPDSDRVILEANQALADLVGYGANELVGMCVSEFSHPDDREADDQATAEQISGDKEAFSARRRYVHKNGHTIWVQLDVRVLSRDGDRVVMIANLINITGEVEAERERAQVQAVLEALGEVRSALLAEKPISETLHLICQRTRDLVAADMVLFTQPDNARESVHLVAYSGRLPRNEVPATFPIDGPLAAALEGHAWRSDDLARADDVSSTNQHSGGEIAGPAMVIPVGTPGATNSLLMVGRDVASQPFDHDAVELISAFAASASAALLLEEARRATKKAELLEDRDRIGRDMHDKVIGRLFATGMSLQSTLGRIDDVDVRARLSAVVDEIDDAIREIRDSIYGLRSRVDWGTGARGAILAVAAEHKAVFGFEPRVNLHGPIDDLSTELIDPALATLREALTNAGKYANATRVTVDVSVEPGTFQLTVVDDGDGFETTMNDHRRSDHTGNGLDNIAARATELGGHATITSAPGSGAKIEWTVPVV